MRNIYICGLIYILTSCSLFAFEKIQIGSQSYNVPTENAELVKEALAQVAHLSDDAKLAYLVQLELLDFEAPRAKHKAEIADFKQRYLGAFYQGNGSHHDLEEEGKHLGLGDSDFGDLERQASSALKAKVRTFETCKDLRRLVDLAGPGVLILLDADDTTITRGMDGNRFVPLQQTTLENIQRMRDKGSKVLILTQRSFDTISEVIRRFEEAGIALEAETGDLFQGVLMEKMEAHGAISSAGAFRSIIAASSAYNKGEVLSNIIKYSPNFFSTVSTIVFSDDSEDNCNHVAQALSNLNFHSRIFHFTNNDHLRAFHYEGRAYQNAEIQAANPQEQRSMEALGFKGTVSEYRLHVSHAAQVGISIEEYLGIIAIDPPVPPKAPVQMKECGVCLDEFEQVVPTPCNKSICNDCLQHYYNTMVKENGFDYDAKKNNSFVVKCPTCKDASCQLPVSKEETTRLLGKDTYNSLKERATTAALKYCPHQACGGVYFPEDLNEAKSRGNLYLQCGECNKNICIQCEKIYQGSEHRCDAQALLNIEFNDTIKPCPNPACTNVMEKNEGCLTMQCGGNPDNPHQKLLANGCGATFCWDCGAWIPYEEGKRQSLHDPNSVIYSPNTTETCQHRGLDAFNCDSGPRSWWKNE